VEYKGTMVRCDGYMNILLDGASEHVNDAIVANYGNVLVRGNNVLYIAIDVPHK
jgi:small nuclear ribonucleoprotein